MGQPRFTVGVVSGLHDRRDSRRATAGAGAASSIGGAAAHFRQRGISEKTPAQLARHSQV